MRRQLFQLVLVCGVLLIAAGLLLTTGTAAVAQEDIDDEFADLDYEESDSCGSCHGDIADIHATTAHALTLRELDDEEDALGDFSLEDELLTVQLPDARRAQPIDPEDDIEYILGAGRSQQMYLVEGEDRGTFMILPFYWDVAASEWVELVLAEEWPDPAYLFGPNCMGCHVTDTDIDVEDEDFDWEEDGVQCEACHGPASAHLEALREIGGDPSTPEERRLVTDSINSALDSQTCGQCHIRGSEPEFGLPYPLSYLPGRTLADVYTPVPLDSDPHWWETGQAQQPNMQFNEWSLSSHAGSLAALGELEDVDPACLGCHSATYDRAATLLAANPDVPLIPTEMVESLLALGVSEDAMNAYFTTLAESAGAGEVVVDFAGIEAHDGTLNELGVTCASCHNPHNGAEQYLTAESSYELCAECHSNERFSAWFGEGIHHPVIEMFEGTTLIAEVPGSPSPHFTAEGGPDCQTCHMPDMDVFDVTAKQRISHMMQPILPGEALNVEGLVDGCSECHVELATPEDLQTLIDDVQTSTETRLTAARAAVGNDTPQWVTDALDFVEGDASGGVHNYGYSDVLLDAAEVELGLNQRGASLVDLDPNNGESQLPLMDVEFLGLPLLVLGLIGIGALNLFVALGFLLFGGKRRAIYTLFTLVLAVGLIGGGLFINNDANAMPDVTLTGVNPANCAICHADDSTFTLADGNVLHLNVNVEALNASVHGANSEMGAWGCMDCHGENVFPHEGALPTSLREYRATSSEFCIDCHFDSRDHWDAVLARNIQVGCTDCHTGHYVVPVEQLPADALPRVSP